MNINTMSGDDKRTLLNQPGFTVAANGDVTVLTIEEIYGTEEHQRLAAAYAIAKAFSGPDDIEYPTA